MRLSAKKSMDGTDTVVLGNDGADIWTMRFRWSSAISTRKEDYTTRLPKQGSTKLGGDGCDICVARTRGCAAACRSGTGAGGLQWSGHMGRGEGIRGVNVESGARSPASGLAAWLAGLRSDGLGPSCEAGG